MPELQSWPAPVQHSCPPGQYNDLATVWLSPAGEGGACSPASGWQMNSFWSAALYQLASLPCLCCHSVEYPLPHFSGHEAGAHQRRGACCAVLRCAARLLDPVPQRPSEMTVFLQACMLGSSAAGCFYSPASLAAMCAAYLALMGLSAALAIPGGLFMPSMMVGGSFGALAGFALRAALPGLGVQPGLYALCCATAVLGGVFRSSISLAVLMMEATGGPEGC